MLTLIPLFLGAFSRIIPHVPNATGIIYCSLFLSATLPFRHSFLPVMAMWLISDLLLSSFYGYSFFGSWVFFNYSGVIALILLGNKIPRTANPLLFCSISLSASFLFWIWTNLGTWLFSDLYGLNMQGLIQCYTAALPFLKNQLAGDIIIGFIIMIVIFRLDSLPFLSANKPPH